MFKSCFSTHSFRRGSVNLFRGRNTREVRIIIKLSRKEALERKPKTCYNCNSEKLMYWDETDEEIIFQCANCKKYYPIAFDPDKLKLYLFC